MIFRFIGYPARIEELLQQPGGLVAPMAEDDLANLSVTELENTPVTGHGGAVGGGLPIVNWGEGVDGTIGETNVVVRGGSGLSPGLLISVDPIGMLARPDCRADRGGIDEPALPAPAPPVPM